MEADEKGVTAKNTYGGPLLLRTEFGEEETTYEYLYNAHGDVVTLLSGGAVAATYYYDSFGNVLEQTGDVDNSILYAGYQYDEETGLYYINARMYDPVTARFLQADTYLGNTSDPLSLNLYTYCLNNPHKYTDPSGHIPLLLIGAALLVGAVSAQAEYKRQVREGDNYTNLVSIGVVGISNTLLCLIPGGKAVSAYKMATAGGSFVLKTFAVQFGKAVGLGVAAGYATDAGIEVARQLATGTKLSNLEYDRINEAGVTGAIAGGAGAIFGAGVEALANTRVGQSVAAKFTQAVSKGRGAIKNGFAKVAGKSEKSSVREMTGLGESRFKLNLQFFASDEVYESGRYLADFDDLANYRRQQGMPVVGSVEDKHTAAKLIIGDNVYYGKNGHGKQKDVASVFTVNPQTATHAEGDVFYQAKLAGKKDTTAVLVTDRCACRACGFNGGIRSMAKQMGITDLTIVSPAHNPIRFNPQVKPDPNPFK